MILDPSTVFVLLSSSLPVLYLGWASLNCFSRKAPAAAPPPAPAADAGFSRLVSESVEASSPRSCRSSIDSQLVSWERAQLPPEVWDE
jgi:hypothetical protein